MTVHDSTVQFAVGMLQLSYDGKLSADGKIITGTWTGRFDPFYLPKDHRGGRVAPTPPRPPHPTL